MGESMTDEQLLLISNLLHIVKEKDFPAGFFDLKNASEENTIGKMLEKLLKGGTLEKLRADTSGELYNGEISPQEWAAMLEQIQSDEQLCGMTLRAYEKDDKNGISVCLKAADILKQLDKYVGLENIVKSSRDDPGCNAYQIEQVLQRTTC